MDFHDGRLWSSLAMLKLSAVNTDQCPSQCDEKYRETQGVVGITKRMIDMVGRVVNTTDDVIQGLSRSEFPSDLGTLKDVSYLIQNLYNTFTTIPKSQSLISKGIAKMLSVKRKGGSDRPHSRPVVDDDDDTGPTTISPGDGSCWTEPIEEMLEYSEDDGMVWVSLFFLLMNY